MSAADVIAEACETITDECINRYPDQARLILDELTVAGFAVDGAREALAPIRKLHAKMPLYMDCEYGYGGPSERDVCDDGFEALDGEWCCPTCTHEFHGGPEHVCGECRTPDGERTPWPCDTAKLVYDSAELDPGKHA